MRVTVRRTVTVEAEDEEEAREKALEYDVLHEGRDEDTIDWDVEGSPRPEDDE